MRVKICGITQTEQGKAIASLGATALGFVCFPKSPRYVTPKQISEIISQIPAKMGLIGVFVHTSLESISTIVAETGLTGVQLHGDETPQFCYQLREMIPQVELIKALRIRNTQDIERAKDYFNCIDTLLLDAYHPQDFGGTGKTIDWKNLINFRPPIPWLLAGGLTPDNVLEAVNLLSPDGIDLSSGVERSPGDKDLEKVKQLFSKLNDL